MVGRCRRFARKRVLAPLFTRVLFANCRDGISTRFPVLSNDVYCKLQNDRVPLTVYETSRTRLLKDCKRSHQVTSFNYITVDDLENHRYTVGTKMRVFCHLC